MKNFNKENLINKCLINNDAIITYPFEDEKYRDLAVLRHKTNKKWFALIYEKDEELCLNLKALPTDISILKDQYPDSIKSAWHMNKKHWCMVLANKLDKDVLDVMIKNSFNLTAPKRTKHN